MSQTPLMPKATAVWLVDRTSLTFNQIADFCKLHPLEVKAIADGDAAQGIKGLDPIMNGQLSREEIEKGQKDEAYTLKMSEPKVRVPKPKKKTPRYTPVSRRQDRPNAILWLLRNHPELKDAQIIRLVGTTKHTIGQIRERTHWNSSNLQPMDPVILGLCKQLELDMEVKKAEKYKTDNVDQPAAVANIVGTQTLLDPSQSAQPNVVPEDFMAVSKSKEEDDAPDAHSVFSQFDKSAKTEDE